MTSKLVFEGAVNAFELIISVRYMILGIELIVKQIPKVRSKAINRSPSFLMGIFELTGFWISSLFFKPSAILIKPASKPFSKGLGFNVSKR